MVKHLKEVNANLVTATQQLLERNIDLYEKLDYLRLLRALRLLKVQPEYSIEAIAHKAGFATVRTLNRKI